MGWQIPWGSEQPNVQQQNPSFSDSFFDGFKTIGAERRADSDLKLRQAADARTAEEFGWKRDDRTTALDAGKIAAAGDINGAQNRLLTGGKFDAASTYEKNTFDQRQRSRELAAHWAGIAARATNEAEMAHVIDQAKQNGADVSTFGFGNWEQQRALAKLYSDHDAKQLALRKTEAEISAKNADAALHSAQAGQAKFGTIPGRAEAVDQYAPGMKDEARQRFILDGSFAKNNGGGFDDKYAEKAAGQAADIHGDYIKEGQKARVASADLARMKQLSDVVGSGKFAQLVPIIGPWAQSLGINLSGLSEAEAFQAIANKMAPSLRPSGSGATSDRDMAIFMSSIPQLSQTQAGRNMIIEHMGALQKFTEARGQIAQQAIGGRIPPQVADDMISRLPVGSAFLQSDLYKQKLAESERGAGPAPGQPQKPGGSLDAGRINEIRRRYQGADPAGRAAIERSLAQRGIDPRSVLGGP